MRDRTLYQDLHLTGKAANGHLTWIAGGEMLFQHDTYRAVAVTSPCAFTLTGSFCGGQPGATFCVKPLPTSLNCPAVFPLAFGADSNTRQTINSYAAYALLQYSVGGFSVAGEGRFSHDYKQVTQFIYSLYTTTYPKVPTTFAFKSNQPAYIITFSYKTSDPTGTLIYAKMGTGYRVRAGSITARSAPRHPTRSSSPMSTRIQSGMKSASNRSS